MTFNQVGASSAQAAVVEPTPDNAVFFRCGRIGLEHQRGELLPGAATSRLTRPVRIRTRYRPAESRSHQGRTPVWQLQ